MKLPKGRHRPRVGRLPYLIALPFAQPGSGAGGFEWITAPPRQLAHLAREDELDAVCLPITEVRSLSKRFEPLGALGLSVAGPCPAAYFASRIEAGLLHRAPIGVSRQAAAAQALLAVILRHRYDVGDPNFVPLEPERRALGAFLAVGDDALRAALRPEPGFDHAYDLLAEWREWTGQPFVLARWMVRKTLADETKERLLHTLEEAVAATLCDPAPHVSAHLTEHALDVPRDTALSWLAACRYTLEAPDFAAADHFLRLAHDLERPKPSWRRGLMEIDLPTA